MRVAASLAAACLLVLRTAAAQPEYRAVKMVFGPGVQPFRVPGERGSGEPRKCPPGSYKCCKGAYPCKKCGEGSIASGRGARKCHQCPHEHTSNAARTACIRHEGGEDRKVVGVVANSTAAKKTPSSAAVRAYQSSLVKKDATVPRKGAACDMEQSGSMRCGISVGYNNNGRTGTYFVPKEYKDHPIPYMLLWHGSGWTGSDMINVFKQYSIQYKYGIVAPDSHNAMFWSSPDTASAPWTADWFHVQACWDWTMKQPHVVPNKKFISSFGNSRAGYAAVAFASRSPTNYNSAVIIHAAALGTQCGSRSFPILWATGIRDPLYGPSAAVPDIRRFKQVTKNRYPITYRVSQTSHTIRNYTEVTGWITWWLQPKTRNAQWRTRL